MEINKEGWGEPFTYTLLQKNNLELMISICKPNGLNVDNLESELKEINDKLSFMGKVENE